MKKNAVIICDEKDFLSCKKKIEYADFFSNNYTFYEQCKNHNVNYLYSKSKRDHLVYNNIGYFCQNWFRNKNGKDISTDNDISFSLSLSRRSGSAGKAMGALPAPVG